MGKRMLIGLAGVAAGGAMLMQATAQVPGQCSPSSIGLARTLEIDTAGGPRFGQSQYTTGLPLRDGEVVLTFDDGPHKVHSREVLDALAAHCTKATFFMVGQRAIAYPEIVREIARRGHSIGTHTWSHQNLAKIEPRDATGEIELGISAVQMALGAPAAPFFRFPYLSDPRAMQAHLRARDTANFSIDVDSHDFKTRSPTVVIRNVLGRLESKRGGIILFHDIQPSTAGALNTLLSELKARGYKVVHVVPRAGQTTVAEYDQRVARQGSRIASLPVPVAQRGILAPAWEVQVNRGPGQGVGREGVEGPGLPPTSVPTPRAAAQPRPSRRAAEEDWRWSVFRNW